MGNTNYMKDMTVKQKVDHIWDYYKIHMIVGVLVLAFIGFLTATQLSKVEYVANLTFTENVFAQTDTAALQEKVTAGALGEKSEGLVRIEVLPINEQGMQAYLQKLMAELSVGEIDVLVMGRENFQKFLKQGAFQPVDKVKGLEVDGLTGFVAGIADANKEKANYGISLDGANGERLKSLGILTDNQVLCVANTMEHTENTVKLINWILGR